MSAGTEAICRVCRAADPPFERAVAHGAYQGTLRTLLHLLKYEGMQPLAGRLGILLAGRVLRTPGLPGELVMVPVPLFGAKRRQRGFNQAEALARGALKAIRQRRPEMRVVLAAGVLRRQRATESQAGLSPHERRVNVRGAFFVSRPELVAGQNALLIDDIYTTGATARACSAALRKAGAKSVWVATVARAQWEFPPGRAEAGRTDGERRDEAIRAPEPELPMDEDFVFWEEGRTVEAGGAAS